MIDSAREFRAAHKIPEPAADECAQREHTRAAIDAEVCWDCGRDLHPEEPVYRTRRGAGTTIFGGWSFSIVAICHACSGKVGYSIFLAPRPCEACGRPVSNEGKSEFWLGRWGVFETPREYWFCSPRCAAKLYHAKDHAKRRARVAAARPKVCRVCGEAFKARADADTCSAACRQKKYRGRR